MQSWFLDSRFDGRLSSVGSLVGLDYPKGLLQTKQFNDSN